MNSNDDLSIYRRPAWEISQTPHEWVEKIFAEQGWARTPKGAKWEGDRQLAARQVAESRADRAAGKAV